MEHLSNKLELRLQLVESKQELHAFKVQELKRNEGEFTQRCEQLNSAQRDDVALFAIQFTIKPVEGDT